MPALIVIIRCVHVIVNIATCLDNLRLAAKKLKWLFTKDNADIWARKAPISWPLCREKTGITSVLLVEVHSKSVDIITGYLQVLQIWFSFLNKRPYKVLKSPSFFFFIKVLNIFFLYIFKGNNVSFKRVFVFDCRLWEDVIRL